MQKSTSKMSYGELRKRVEFLENMLSNAKMTCSLLFMENESLQSELKELWMQNMTQNLVRFTMQNKK